MSNTNDLLFFGSRTRPTGLKFGPPPTRDQLCAIHHQFQGISIPLPAGSTFDPLMAKYWFDPLITEMDKPDRLAVYAEHRRVGDRHINISLDLGGLTTLPKIVNICYEAIIEGGLTGIILMCMGDGQTTPGGGYDPNSLGREWLYDNFQAIYDVFRADNTGDPDNSLAHRVIFVPGYDGVVPAWQPPSAVDKVILRMRQAVDAGGAGAVGLELSSGYPTWGDEHGIEGNNWVTDAGRAIDVVLYEGPIGMHPPPPVPANLYSLSQSEIDRYTQFYQIVGRMVSPYYPVPGQFDDLHAPFLLHEGTPRGPFYFVYWEFDTYEWTLPWRHGFGGMNLAEIFAHRQAAYDAGCPYVG